MSRFHRWNDRQAVVSQPIFPGYVFARIGMADRVQVLSIPGVINFVGAPGRPCPIPDEELNALSTRERVLRAATLLFAAKGFEGTSTRDVARRAKVNESTIFRLFKNKQGLYLCILDGKMGLSAPEWLNTALRSSEDPEKALRKPAARLSM